MRGRSRLRADVPSHLLGAVEGRILERGEAHEPVDQGRRQYCTRKVDPVAQHGVDSLRHRSGDPGPPFATVPVRGLLSPSRSPPRQSGMVTPVSAETGWTSVWTSCAAPWTRRALPLLREIDTLRGDGAEVRRSLHPERSCGSHRACVDRSPGPQPTARRQRRPRTPRRPPPSDLPLPGNGQPGGIPPRPTARSRRPDLARDASASTGGGSPRSLMCFARCGFSFLIRSSASSSLRL